MGNPGVRSAGPGSCGVLRAALDSTQSDLARLSGVKRSSLSEYERGRSAPDAMTLERLLVAMGFRWTALDFAGWFVERLAIDCRLFEKEDARGDAAPLLVTASALATRLSTDVAVASQTVGRLSQLVLRLQEETKIESPFPQDDDPGTPARDRVADRRAAQELWARIKPLTRKAQLGALRDVPPEAKWAMSELLCSESQRLCGEDPVKAASLCELALTAADLAEGGEGLRAKLRGIAWAHLGNALRARDDFDGAEGAFTSAEAYWKIGEDAADGLLEEGLIFALKASLRREQRRFDEATELLERAFLLASSATFRLQVMISKAKVQAQMGDLEEAVTLLGQVKEMASPEERGMASVLYLAQPRGRVEQVGAFQGRGRSPAASSRLSPQGRRRAESGSAPVDGRAGHRRPRRCRSGDHAPLPRPRRVRLPQHGLRRGARLPGDRRPLRQPGAYGAGEDPRETYDADLPGACDPSRGARRAHPLPAGGRARARSPRGSPTTCSPVWGRRGTTRSCGSRGRCNVVGLVALSASDVRRASNSALGIFLLNHLPERAAFILRAAGRSRCQVLVSPLAALSRLTFPSRP